MTSLQRGIAMTGHTAFHLATVRIGVGALLLLTAACSKSPGNEQLVVGNAVGAEERIVDQADDRADHLDERSAELADEAKTVGGAAGRALQNESDADLDAAAAIRAQGQEQSVDARDKIERDAKIVGNTN